MPKLIVLLFLYASATPALLVAAGADADIVVAFAAGVLAALLAGRLLGWRI